MGIEVIIGVVTGVVTLATYVVKLIGEIKGNSAETKLTEIERLMAVAQMAVATAEQNQKTQGWDKATSHAYAADAIRAGFPQATEATVQATVAAAVALFNKAAGT